MERPSPCLGEEEEGGGRGRGDGGERNKRNQP